MRALKIPWGLAGAFFATIYLHAFHAAAGPSINVALKTSFDSAPYLLELLETAADENATSYFPILGRIAEGHFESASTDKELYERFIKLLQDEGHITDTQTLSSFQLALSLRSAAPRIEAHCQYYDTAVKPSIKIEKDLACPTWVLSNGLQYCSPSLDEAHGEVRGNTPPQDLPFDRVMGNKSAPASILYADITSPAFRQFHKTLVQTAREGKTSYRVRYRKPPNFKSMPLEISGYGVELALKRTDYIVIDDRKEEDVTTIKADKMNEVMLEDEELADLKPLSTSELHSLALKAASFVMQSENPFETLIKLSQDFPKFSTAVAAHNTSTEFLVEHFENRGLLVPAGVNVLWINGIQIFERQVDAFTLLDILRRERRLINSVQELGLTSPEAINLLSHSAVALAKSGDGPQRFDWRDTIEGGNVIIWLNDIENDKRYEGWPTDLNALLQRTFPGQLPSVRRDIFNLVIPVDLSQPEDVQLVAEQIQAFVKRRLPLRFGIVPLSTTSSATEQAKIIYHLLDSYGLSAAMSYLESILDSNIISASQPGFDKAVAGRKLRRDKVANSLQEVLIADKYGEQIENSKKWVSRLSANGPTPPFFMDGVAYPRNENWLQMMSNRVNMDLQILQRAVFEESLTLDAWVPTFFLNNASTRRNPLIIPEDEDKLKVHDLNKLYADHSDAFGNAPLLPADPSAMMDNWAHMVLIVDLSTSYGQQLLATTARFRESNPGIELLIIHNTKYLGGALELLKFMKEKSFEPLENANDLTRLQDNGTILIRKVDTTEEGYEEALRYWTAIRSLVGALGLQPGEQGLLINGRLVGPIPAEIEFLQEDLVQLLEYERSKRIIPAHAAMTDLGLSDKITDPLTGAKISSIVAVSTISDVPEGIFEQTPTLRISSFDMWKSEHTAIEVGDISTASIRITAAVDLAGEQAQRWIPILKVLSELKGIYMKLFLNPRDRLQELPIKRFYRYVLDSKPSFKEDGSLKTPWANFGGVPQEALLTVGMDVPPSWLVAPKKSVHDLDNVKLSSTKLDIDAVYELENILIEGHSREVPGGAAPRGAQLVLRTERDPHFADTIIMANLGYFQFKANPGFYKIDLQAGRSSEIFKIDSVGPYGYNPVPGDESTEIALMSFQGTTLYPRLSRNLGQEKEDVLEAKTNSTKDFVSHGLKFAENILGFGKLKKSENMKVQKQAEINIFSVASGHLYERMLNIMMVSVMKHTKHSVKFWFIEQFLSPSFKDFIPHLAAEYGFQYEMVTFKWPHWLRAQTEKQREIWGYKILFLDVLFPLSLDKVIFVDADQIVRTDMIELVNHDLEGAPYGFTPMCDSRTEMEGFRFWKQGYWKSYLKGLPYHISALYVVDLRRFRQIAAGDRLRQQYHQLSADPQSLSNLDQDLPNHMQPVLPIHSLPQEWLWCETWCSDESLKEAKTIDLCNNPLTKEPKLDRARRQVPEWTMYDDEIAAVDKRRKGLGNSVTGTVMEAKNTKSRNHEEPATSRIIDEL